MKIQVVVLLALAGFSVQAQQAEDREIPNPLPSVSSAGNSLPNYAQLKNALKDAQSKANGGFNLDMWATVVNRDGMVCAVAFTGNDRGDQWPGSRVISAQKANTANAFSLPGLALSTANLYTAVQPGGSLFGLQDSNPVDTDVAYGGNPANYGQTNDPMVGGRIGGVNVFGGGLALYNASGQARRRRRRQRRLVVRRSQHRVADAQHAESRLRAGGVSGDATPSGQHRLRHHAAPGDAEGVSRSGWGHPKCSDTATTIAASLPAIP